MCAVRADDMTEHNGTLCLLPGAMDQSADPDLLAARATSNSGGGSGGGGGGSGGVAAREMVVSAGSVVAFSSMLWHSSSSNRSHRWRRAFYVQCSRRPIRADAMRTDQPPIAFAVPAAAP